MENSLSVKRQIRCATPPGHSGNFGVINNPKSKYMSLLVNSGYNNISNRFDRFSTRLKLFGPINEEMRQASLHFTQKGKYSVLHDAVVSCG
jgi:hypothetical protein